MREIVVILIVSQLVISETFVTSPYTSLKQGQGVFSILNSKNTRKSESYGPRANTTRICWVDTSAKDVLTASIECGQKVFSFFNESLLSEWRSLGQFQALVVHEINGSLRIIDEKSGEDRGAWILLDGPDAQRKALSLAGHEDLVVLDAQDWKIIPAENLIASYQPTRTQLLVVVSTAREAKVLFETLEVGTNGVVLRTQSPSEVIAMRKLVHDWDVPCENLVECQVRLKRK